MRRFLFLPLVAITTTLFAQTPAPTDNKKAEDPATAPCTVTGRVVTAPEGDPLKSARISLIPEHNRSHDQMYSASSDSEGHFTIKDVPPGSYQFMASHTGFVEQHYKAGSGDTAPLFSLHPGEKVSDVLFRLTAAAVITGRVTNEDGESMQRVEVVALRRPNEEEREDEELEGSRRRKVEMQPVGSASSDDRGQYRIFGLKPGEYFVKAEDNFRPQGNVPVDESFWLQRELGSDYAPVYFPSAVAASQAQAVPIKPGEEAQADITMRHVKTVEITGRLIGPNGPAYKAFVSLQPAEGVESDFDRQDTTDDKGNFRLRNVPEGTYYVLAYLPRDEGVPVYETRARQKIEVAGDNIENLTISLNAGVTIQGKLKVEGSGSEALDRVQFSLRPLDEDSPSGGFAEVKKDGSFEIKSVQEGSYSISVWGLDPKAYVKSAQRGPDDLLEKGVQIEADSSGKIELTIASDAAQLEGSVTDDDGPMIGARVRVVPDPLTPYNHLRIHRTTTDQVGHFSIADIAPGKYRVTAKPMVSSESATYKSEPQSVTVSENDHKTIEMKLEKQKE